MSMIGVDPDETADYLDGKSEHAAADGWSRPDRPHGRVAQLN